MKVAVCDDNREFCEKERTTIKDVFKQYFQGEDCQVDIYNDGQTIINNYSDAAYDVHASSASAATAVIGINPKIMPNISNKLNKIFFVLINSYTPFVYIFYYKFMIPRTILPVKQLQTRGMFFSLSLLIACVYFYENLISCVNLSRSYSLVYPSSSYN